MYADDLLLLALSMMDLQAMIDICEKEFLLLGMKINVNKSKYICVGKRYKEKVVSPIVELNTIVFSTE